MSLTGYKRNDEALKEAQDRANKKFTTFGPNPDVDMLYLNEGKTTVRVLPPYSEKGVFFKEVAKHFIPNPNPDGRKGEFITDPEGVGLEVVQRKAEELYATKDEASLEIAKDLKPARRYLYNVLVYSGPPNNSGEPLEQGKVYVLEAPITVHRQIMELDQDEGAGWADVTSIENGVNLVITRTGKGFETKYNVTPHGQGRSNAVDYLTTVVGFNQQQLASLKLNNLDEVYSAPNDAEVEHLLNKLSPTVSAPTLNPTELFQQPQPAPPFTPNTTGDYTLTGAPVTTSSSDGEIPVPKIPAPPSE